MYVVWLPDNNGPLLTKHLAASPLDALAQAAQGTPWDPNDPDSGTDWASMEKEVVPGLVWTFDDPAVFAVASPQGRTEMAKALQSSFGSDYSAKEILKWWPKAITDQEARKVLGGQAG